MSNRGEQSSIVATKKVNGYRLDQYCAGRVIASFVGSFLFCHQRKMRVTWRNAACPHMPESLVDFRIRGNFGGSILELRHTVPPVRRRFPLVSAAMERFASQAGIDSAFFIVAANTAPHFSHLGNLLLAAICAALPRRLSSCHSVRPSRACLHKRYAFLSQLCLIGIEL